MKLLYKMLLFFAIFYIVVVMVNIMSIFPNTLYSDDNTRLEDIRNNNTPMGIIQYLFDVPDIKGLGMYTDFTFGMLMALFLVIGAAHAKISGSYSAILIVVLASVFIPMLTRSRDFFNKILLNWDQYGYDSMFYLALAIGVGVLIIGIITILETPSHGRSGT